MSGIAAVLFLICLIYPDNAFAYIDPGTGSYFFQLLIAGVLGVLFTFKLFWNKIILFFVKISALDKEKKHEK